MPYEDTRYKEHHEVRLPLLKQLLGKGWNRDQIICPSPDSDDREWQVPRTPSDNSVRESGRRFAGFPVDMAIFDEPQHRGEWDHVIALVETKAPTHEEGISQLETYLGLEPNAVLGIWSNGSSISLVYKQVDLHYKVIRDAALPSPSDNILFAGDEPLTYGELRNHEEISGKGLNHLFSELLDHIVAGDSKSTRADDRLDNMCDMLLLKMDSDTNGKMARNPDEAVLEFQILATPQETAKRINACFEEYVDKYPFLFEDNTSKTIKFDDETIHAIVYRLQNINLKAAAPETLSAAFQVFRSANVKQGEGQYFTPQRIIEAAVKLTGVDYHDKVIDPACGTGGFLFESYSNLLSQATSEQKDEIRTWAHHNLYGVDLDSINVKLSRALMIGARDGSTNIVLGDSLREGKWLEFPKLAPVIGHEADGSYSVVLTNPPFGEKLKIKATDAKAAEYSICKHTSGGAASDKYADTELGLVFMERAYRLLANGGRLGIVLPETYFFSTSYRWFRTWVDERFDLLAVMNVPMEAFQGFCRAKTNFYVMRKRPVGDKPALPLPSWAETGRTWITYAPTIGINKDGKTLFKVNKDGIRTAEIDDKVLSDVEALVKGKKETETSRFVPTPDSLSLAFLGVPQYYDQTSVLEFERYVGTHFGNFSTRSLGDLVDDGIITVENGHGSPSADTRNGTIPYVKVSDLRAGMVNFNSTNMVPLSVAQRFWHGTDSGLSPWSIVTPSRASKNIGEPSVLLPGQEQAVFTKETLIMNTTDKADFDNFYLGWALDLDVVRRQWARVVFMQTNREDLGTRYREILIPIPDTREDGERVSLHYREYYQTIARSRSAYLKARASQNQ
ncbi:HsdM family class I SAM-dependent methyltransferase [Bifidobacterium aesculapii]|uniref:HsdM family class I SAM-dependent methyltransferase n=1 Tax=Bifidobacterium aesculapii TaxID=1329411 RepID=UPI0006E1768B|nr:N-6 DNA methylase [Bifidobacterium aesculapii]